MIYLSPQSKSSLGDDTFWTWFEREFVSSFDIPAEIGPNDVVLQYSILGPSNIIGGKKVGLLWELFPEMKLQNIQGYDYNSLLSNIHLCEKQSDFSTVASGLMKNDFHPMAYELPIGIDTDLFRPRNKKEMREKYGYSQKDILGFWCGTHHHMKGFDQLLKYSKVHPEVQFIVVFKEEFKSQKELAELMSCADFGFFTGRLRPYFMVEWEMMACDLPIIDISGMERDFMPGGRDRVFEKGWSRIQAKESWYKFLKNVVKSEVYFR